MRTASLRKEELDKISDVVLKDQWQWQLIGLFGSVLQKLVGGSKEPGVFGGKDKLEFDE